MLSARVAAGASGAALVDARGALQGLVTSNTQHQGAGTFPHLSFAIAAGLLRPVCDALAQGPSTAEAARRLRALDNPRPKLQRLWDLGPLSLPQREQPPGSQGQGLGRLRELVQQGPSRL